MQLRGRLQTPSLESVAVGASGAVAYLALLAWPARRDLEGLFRVILSVQVGPWLWWAGLGAVLTGAVLAVFAYRNHLVSPILVAVLVWLWVRNEEVQSDMFLPGSPYDLYLVGWPLVLGLVLFVAGIEMVLRPWSARPARG